VIVFTGPTLPPDDVRQHLDAVCAPPVSQGDVYQASLDGPWAIAIIDGYFERVPAVWHKEILWAMARGIHVFGAASMGAIRASELAQYGMVGIGQIFEDFHRGTITDDDEVAVRHEQGSNGFRAVSEAMVNLRATFREAMRSAIISDATQTALVTIGKGLFYAERTYPAVLEKARKAGIDVAELDRLQAWLPAGRVDQKRRDAVEMLEHIADLAARDRAPMRPTFTFEHTDMWEQVGRRRRAAAPSHTERAEGWRDELRLAGPRIFDELWGLAFARAVALEEARRQGVSPGADQVAARAARFRDACHLSADDAFVAWLAAQHLSADEFLMLMADEVRLDQVRALYEPETAAHLRDLLRLDGRYGGLIERARAKQELLARHGLQQVSLEASGISPERLVEWFSAGGLGGERSGGLDVCAARLGCADRDALLSLLLREWWYRRMTEHSEVVTAPDPHATGS
jgi:hypothetical protein